MRRFEPTLGIKDTTKNVNAFIKEHMPVFWDIIKPLAPFIISLYIIDIIITNFFMPTDTKTGEKIEFPLGSIIAGYFYACIAITWHRVVIHGADNFIAMNPFKPKKSELTFIGMGIALFIGIPLIGFILVVATTFFAPAAMVLIIAIVAFAIITLMRIMFYFPSKATGGSITLKKSRSMMTAGYFCKLYTSYIFAIIKTLLIFIGFIILIFTISTILLLLASKLGPNIIIVQSLLESILIIPAIIYFQPLFTIIWVTILSNYYQHALQNKGVPE